MMGLSLESTSLWKTVWYDAVKGEAGTSCDPGPPPPDIYFQKFTFKKRFTCVYSETCKDEDKIPQPEMGQALKTMGRTYQQWYNCIQP